MQQQRAQRAQSLTRQACGTSNRGRSRQSSSSKDTASTVVFSFSKYLNYVTKEGTVAVLQRKDVRPWPSALAQVSGSAWTCQEGP